MRDNSKIAFDIISVFEDLLDRHNITLPDIHREGNKEEARIYGDTYYDLEEEIIQILEEEESGVKLCNCGNRAIEELDICQECK